jgi:hypothetical protein
MKYKRLNDYLNELKFNKRADLLNETGKERLVELEHALKQLTLTDVAEQSEQLCDNPHCEDGIVDRDMYGHPIYCQVCDKHN